MAESTPCSHAIGFSGILKSGTVAAEPAKEKCEHDGTWAQIREVRMVVENADAVHPAEKKRARTDRA
jgi:hypothetical protein